MDAPLGTSDAELVSRVLTADREAFAVVYDRYGPRLYDFAYSMLRHREDASDAVADSFVTFAEKLPQLREPDRLRPWLYAIVRSECLRRLKARKRVSYGDDEQLIQMPDDSATPEQSAETVALQKLVWDAAAGLADRDRAILDLHLRQGLEGAELGEAMGVSAANAYVMLNRLRAQVDKSLGALLIARLGRDDCEELDSLLVDWDGSFSPLIRKRVARHVESCDVCGERRKKMVSPWMLLAGVPVFAAPVALRDRVLDDTQLVAYAAPGEQVSAGAGSGRTIKPRVAAAAATAAVVLIGGGALLWPDGDKTPVAADPTPTATVSSPATSPTPTPSQTDAPTTASTTPSAEPTASQAPASLSTPTQSISLGRTGNRGSVTLGNAGDLPLTFAVAENARWLSVSRSSGTLEGDASTTITVRANRDGLPEGTTSATVRITSDAGSTSVRVSLVEEHDPVVGRPSAPAPTCDDPTVVVRASVSDESGLTSVRVVWTGPNGPGSTKMSRSDGRWVGTMGPFTFGGKVTFHVIATDTRGNSTTGPSASVNATPCPG